MATIFIVDDDQAIGEMLSLVLENEGFQTVTCLDGLRAVEMFPIVKPDLILLDVMLPGLDGTEVARRIRATSNVPIIMLTAKSDTLDVVAGLEAGADDYVLKPFSLAVLGARVKAHLARDNRQHVRAEVRFDGDIAIDYRSRTVTAAGRPVELTRREFDIVAFLSKHPGQVFDRDRIHERVGGWENESDSQVVTEHIRRIRKKLAAAGAEPDPVETVWGMGYRWRA